MNTAAQLASALVSALIVVAPAVITAGIALCAFLPHPRFTLLPARRRKAAPSTCENTQTRTTPRRTA